jgi:hypothetical protein
MAAIEKARMREGITGTDRLRESNMTSTGGWEEKRMGGGGGGGGEEQLQGGTE